MLDAHFGTQTKCLLQRKWKLLSDIRCIVIPVEDAEGSKFNAGKKMVNTPGHSARGSDTFTRTAQVLYLDERLIRCTEAMTSGFQLFLIRWI